MYIYHDFRNLFTDGRLIQNFDVLRRGIGAFNSRARQLLGIQKMFASPVVYDETVIESLDDLHDFVQDTHRGSVLIFDQERVLAPEERYYTRHTAFAYASPSGLIGYVYQPFSGGGSFTLTHELFHVLGFRHYGNTSGGVNMSSRMMRGYGPRGTTENDWRKLACILDLE